MLAQVQRVATCHSGLVDVDYSHAVSSHEKVSSHLSAGLNWHFESRGGDAAADMARTADDVSSSIAEGDQRACNDLIPARALSSHQCWQQLINRIQEFELSTAQGRQQFKYI
jgi:hypothetical protein